MVADVVNLTKKYVNVDATFADAIKKAIKKHPYLSVGLHLLSSKVILS